MRELDLTDWLATYRAALSPDESDLPFSDDFDPGAIPAGDDPDDPTADEAQTVADFAEAFDAEPVKS